MKILLVNPYQNIEPYQLPNLGLGYLASALIKNNFNVTYLDCNKENINQHNWMDYLNKKRYDLIGIQMYSYNYYNIQEMFKMAKKVSPDIITVAGGPHINADAVHTMEDIPYIDYCINGEGEKTFPELTNAIQHNDYNSLPQISNLVYRKDGSIIQTQREFIYDLDNLEPPAWNLMKPDSYPSLAHGFFNKAFPIGALFATRGCPFKCTYCASRVNMGKKLRKRSPENIVDEIEMLVKKFGVKEIHFEDDNFTLKKSFAMQVCELILKRNLKFHWACPNGVRLDTLDKELLQLMEKSGCYSMALGIESGSEKILKSVKKGVTPEKMLEKIKLIRRVTNIRLHGFFIFGFPGETIDDLRQTEDFIMNTPLHRMVVGMFKPLPGTALFEQLKMQKLIPDKNINFAKLTNFSLEPDIPFSELPTNILMQRVKNIQLKFYLRPKIMLGLLREIHSYSQIKYATKYLLYLLGIVKDH